MEERGSRLPSWLLAGFWLSTAIAIAAVVRRLYALAHPSQGGPPPMVALDATFSSHALATILHIVPAAIFVLLAGAVLLRPGSSVWLERLFFVFGAITGATAYVMSAWPVGGWTERSAVLLFNSWFLFSLACAYALRMRGEPEEKRRWMVRAVGILLGIATTRPVMGLLFATSRRTHLTPRQFFGMAFWIGFSINAVAVELWLHSARRAQLRNARS